jgi:uncharacterized membrane protein YphA (DoxX/SURF4 family)
MAMISGLALFPGGPTGAGVLLLRASVASTLLMLGASHSGGANILQFLSILAATSLFAGFQTRVVAGLSLAVPVFSFAAGAGSAPLAILHAVDAVALVLTGPGAWSADAVLFGRRTVKLPGRNDTIV